MKDLLKNITFFLHIYDGQGQLDLEDIAFICLIFKIMMSPGIDWAAVCSLATVILAQMHVRSTDSK